jgi:hypothetical protein
VRTMRTTLGRYRLVEELGRGGMGVVYRADDPELERQVAIKLIHLAAGNETSASELEARFRREAKAAARISHPGVVTIFDVGREGEELFLVMELVTGGSLSARLRNEAYPESREALELAARVADALAAAHAAGLVHRDVKPANILFTETGQVKVTDFGVARAMGDATELTRTGTVVGSPAYMAPEQIKGMAVDPRADVFALGVVLYEMLMRQKPFAADTITTLVYEILHKDPFASPELTGSLPGGISAFLRRALAKEPADRVPSAVAFAAECRRLAASGGAALETTGATTALPLLAAASGGGGAAAAAAEVPSAPPTLPTLAAAGSQAPPPPPVPALPARPLYALPSDHGPAVTATATVVAGRQRLAILGVAVAALVAIAALALWLREVPAAPVGEAPPVPRVSEMGSADAGQAAATTGGEAPIPAAAADTLPVPVVVSPPSPPPGAAAAGAAGGAAAGAPASGTQSLPTAAPAPIEPAPTVPAETAPPAPPPFQPGGPISQVITTRDGVEFHVDPEEAWIDIDGQTIGISDDWDGMGGAEPYRFAGRGTHYARIWLEGYQDQWVRIVVSSEGEDDITDVDVELEKVRRKKK